MTYNEWVNQLVESHKPEYASHLSEAVNAAERALAEFEAGIETRRAELRNEVELARSELSAFAPAPAAEAPVVDPTEAPEASEVHTERPVDEV